jgi:hypothetical protein
VSVLEKGRQLPDEPGNLLVCEAAGVGDPDVRVEWTGPREAVVSHRAGIRVFKAEQARAGVQFVFRPIR